MLLYGSQVQGQPGQSGLLTGYRHYNNFNKMYSVKLHRAFTHSLNRKTAWTKSIFLDTDTYST
jgi:hypothetical protein